MHFREWYEKVYPELHRSGLWLRGGELNTLPPSEYEARPFRALFVRLSTYFDTGYSFTHQILYQLAAGTPGVFPDLAYLPPPKDAAVFARDGVPWLLGTQTKRGPESFDVVGFSNSIVQELINLPTFLEKSGIPLEKARRLERPELPLLILGGANALYSSVLWPTPLVDGVFVGESDQAFRRILEICRDGKAAGRSKRDVLAELEEVAGFVQPDRPRSTRKSFIPNLNQSEALERGPVYYLEDQLGNSHLQISEGCPCFCSFCAESWDRKPYRERGAGELRETALRAKAAMGLETIDIYSFNFNMHSGLYQVLWDLVEPFRNVGLKSQRFDLLAHDPQMVEFQHAIEKASLTCGLEGISPRLRKYLHKNLSNEQLHASLTAILKSKARELKMFLIATGLEEEQDFVALADFLDHLKGIIKSCHAGTRVIFSMTPLVRFPWTPLEFEEAPSIERYSGIIGKTSARVRAAGFEFRESADLPEYWVSQALVRADDPRTTEALLAAIGKTGFVYYREVPEAFLRTLRVELAQRGLEEAELFRGFTLEESAAKPWTRIETGVKREFLWEEVGRARLYKEIDYCLGRDWTAAKCFHCGGCPTRFHVRDIVLSQQKRAYSLDEFKARISVARKSETKLRLLVEAGEPARGVPRKLLGVALARALMLTDSRLAPAYRGYGGAFWADEDREVWVTGADVVTLTWQGDALERIAGLLESPAAIAQVNAHLGAWATLLGLAPEGWRPTELAVEMPYALRADAYLKSRGLKHTLRKQPDGAYLYELIPQSVRKGFVSKLVATASPGRSSCVVTLGPKFVAREFVSEAFAMPKAFDWVRGRMRSIGPTAPEAAAVLRAGRATSSDSAARP
ncbi:MAG: hypothetical protein HY075_00585 [Deltaproteobacteria bacterium]|nr:hypothetical protein [Deltaproteobacteria bacterium]